MEYLFDLNTGTGSPEEQEARIKAMEQMKALMRAMKDPSRIDLTGFSGEERDILIDVAKEYIKEMGGDPDRVDPIHYRIATTIRFANSKNFSGYNDYDLIIGQRGDEQLVGNGGSDILFGLDGDDKIYGDAAYDSQYAGNDKLFGGNGNDRLFGGRGDDHLYGDAGHDILYGESEDSPGNGADHFDGGEGHDRLYGGGGNDTYYLGNIVDTILEISGTPY